MASKSSSNIKLSSTSSNIKLNSSSNLNLNSASNSTSASNLNLTSSSYFEINEDDKQKKLAKHKTTNDIKKTMEPEVKSNCNESNNDDDDYNDDEPYFGGWELILPIDPSTPIGASVKMMIDKSTKNVSKRFLPFPSYIVSPPPRKVAQKVKPQPILPPLYKSFV